MHCVMWGSFLVLSLSFWLLASVPYAEAAPEITSEEHALNSPDGLQHFVVHKGLNTNGETEVQVEHVEIRALMPGKTRSIVMYGRALNPDGQIDAWFYPDESGVIQAQERTSSDPDGWDAASEIILQQVRYKNRWLSGMIAEAILSRMTLTEGMGESFHEKLIQEQIDLKDFDLRVARLERQDPRNPNLLPYEIALSDGWADLSQQISSEGIRNRFLYAAGDIAFYLTGAVLGKGLGKAIEWVIPKAMASAPGVWANSFYEGLSGGLSEYAARASEKLAQQAEKLGLDSEALARFKQTIRWPVMAESAQAARSLLTERIPTMIRGLAARANVAGLLARSIDLVKLAGSGALQQWKYIAASQGLQFGIEVYERRATLFSRNPIVFAKRIFSDKDLVEDVGFMTWDSTVQAGVSTADPNLKRRMVVCGILSFLDSTGASFLVKKGEDRTRSAIDTGWEVSVGNIETQIDLSALKTFEKMAVRTENPKLALLGYAVALVDDGIGYWAYEKVTDKYEAHKKKSVPPSKTSGAPAATLQWIPILGER